MPVLGIVAEYNPFHNGHLHLLKEAHKTNRFSATICVMSGNFLQRGEPAFCNKWARAEMALNSGVDLVIELPFFLAARSAFHFAQGALELLHRTRVVSHLAFGCESDNIHMLKSIADIIATEPDPYKKTLKMYLRRGFSFPFARSKSIQKLIDNSTRKLQDTMLGPNNILAIEYLRVIKQLNLPFTPIAIKRYGSSYHSPELSAYASATAIRQAIISGSRPDQLKKYMPPQTIDILEQEEYYGRCPVLSNSLDETIIIKLRTALAADLAKIYEISEGLEHRIIEAAHSSGTLSELRHSIKSKRYNLTRINRILLYILFDLSKKSVCLFDEYGPLYLHILGFSAKGRKILQKIKNKSPIKTFNRGSEVKRFWEKEKDSIMGQMLDLDIKTSDVYSMLYPSSETRKSRSDFTTSPIRFF